MSKLVLVDGHSILNRAFYGVPELTNSKGLHTNAVYGFLNILFKFLDDDPADALAVAFDRREPTFRHEMYAEYKGTRKPMPEELREQVPVMKEVLGSMGIPILEKAGYEADDILGTIAKRCQKEGMEVSIISGDRDLLQLADEHIRIVMPKTSRGQTEIHYYYPADVRAEYGVTPEEFIDVKALMGDASDNIPGVPSIGEKTATALIQQFHSLDGVLSHLDEVKPPRAQKALREHEDLARLSLALATICVDADIVFDPEAAGIGNLYTEEAYKMMKDLEFKSILRRFSAESAGRDPLENHFRTISSPGDLEEMLGRARDAEAIGAQLLTEEGEIFGLGIAFGENDCYAVPCGGFLTEAYLAASLEDLLSRHSRASVLDLKSMLPFLGTSGTGLQDGCRNESGEMLSDAGVAAYLLNPLKDTYAFDDIARDYLGLTIPSREDLLGKQKLREAALSAPEKIALLLGYMAFTAWKARPVLDEKLTEAGMKKLFYEMEMPVIYTLFHMEQEGILIRREELSAYGEKLTVSISRLEKEIYDETGEAFNINSPKQLGEILFEKMKLPGAKKTKSGYSTAADVLEKLRENYPVVQKILDYRQVAKLKSTYADGLSAYIRPDGRIHGTFNQTITATGRISSTDPNLQNIPVRMELGREIRKLFVPAEGCVFVDADYSQIELRVLAHMSGDENLIGAYRKAEDIHAITASEVFHVPLSEVTPELRRNAKAVNFGIVYGISAFGLSEDLSISRADAKEYIERYFETYPGVKAFLDRLVENAKTLGYAETMFGRRRPVPELRSSNFMQRSFGERVAMNSPIQGTAADIIKIAMIKTDRRLRREGLKSRLVLQVHDELLVEAPEPEAPKVREILAQEMKSAADLSVELEIGMKTGKSWYETK